MAKVIDIHVHFGAPGIDGKPERGFYWSPGFEKAAWDVVFDLRGYPNGNHQVLSHLLREPDSTNRPDATRQEAVPEQNQVGEKRQLSASSLAGRCINGTVENQAA